MTIASENQYYSEIVGNGTPVLFLPAAGWSGNEGLNIADYLSEEYQTHMLDLPGMGRSQGLKGRVQTQDMAAWIKGYLDNRGIKQAIIIGHSLGGALALAFSKHYPNYVTKLVLLDQGHKTFPRIPTTEFGFFGLAIPIISSIERVFGSKVHKPFKPLFMSDENESNEADIDKQVNDFCLKMKVANSDYIRKAHAQPVTMTIEALNVMLGYYRLNLPKLLQSISVPCLLTYATFEGINVKEAKSTTKAIQRLKRLLYAPITIRPVNSGHFVHWGDESLVKVIKDFLNDEMEKES